MWRTGNTEQVIAQVGKTNLRDSDALTVEVSMVNTKWHLRVSDGCGHMHVCSVVGGVHTTFARVCSTRFKSLQSGKWGWMWVRPRAPCASAVYQVHTRARALCTCELSKRTRTVRAILQGSPAF